MKRYILTDVGNILTRFKQRSQLIKEIMIAFGVGDINSVEVFSAAVPDLAQEDYYHGLDTGQFNVHDVWWRLISKHGISINTCPYALFLSLWCRHLEPIIDVVRLYRGLQGKFPLVAVSNGDSEGTRHILYHLIGTHGLKFHEIFVSAERNEKKPWLLFKVADFVVASGARLGDCVFIDDIQEYVATAKCLGIPAIQFDGSQQSAIELKIALAEKGFS